MSQRKINLKGLSANQLEALAKRASELAKDLRAAQPSVALALEAGVKDTSYQTPRDGYITSYYGNGIVTLEDGSQWKAIGHGPTGTAYSVYRHGFVEFVPIEDPSGDPPKE